MPLVFLFFFFFFSCFYAFNCGLQTVVHSEKVDTFLFIFFFLIIFFI